MESQPQIAGAHLEQALAHLKSALIYWQTETGGREELSDIALCLAILIDESGPMPPA